MRNMQVVPQQGQQGQTQQQQQQRPKTWAESWGRAKQQAEEHKLLCIVNQA